MSEKDQLGDSRREFMKKGTLAATALAVGAGATAGSAAAQEEDDGEAVVHAHDFYPNASFEVLTEFDTPTRDSFLENLDEEEDVFDDPDDWNVHAIQIDTDDDSPGGPLAYIMEEETLNLTEGDMGTFNESASFRSPALNLLEVDVTAEEAEEEPEEEEEDDEMIDDEEDDEAVNDEEDDEEVDDEEVDDENNNGVFG
ncbi:calcium-binding protein [Natronolimnohabitans sp. A-GB9]|uniref:calcium-binding protein n=1 Tax=Natronolimnohabitans sp. A-GB9 TaxID=3069757 RepID=UPI0027AFE33D|nr:calcium-binding protein [Natronolimnohabitans sp. A-GB9]MDQ2050146.1 calcium-binding protein [Natronolimnohabitans sp. A-GB9]